MNNKSLIHTIFLLIRKSPHRWIMYINIIVMLLFMLSQYLFLTNVVNNTDPDKMNFNLHCYLWTVVFTPVYELVFNRLNGSVVEDSKQDFERQEYQRYESLTFKSKQDIGAHNFRIKLNQVVDEFDNIFKTIGLSAIHFIPTFVGLFYFTYSTHVIYFLLFTIASFFAVNLLLTNKMIERFVNSVNIKLENIYKYTSIINLKLSGFERGTVKYETLLTFEKQMIKDHSKLMAFWYYIDFCLSISLSVFCLSFLYKLYYGSVGTLLSMILSGIILKTKVVLTFMLLSTIEFLQARAKYDIYQKQYQNASISSSYNKLDFPNELILTKIFIPRPAFNVVGPSFSIRYDERILIFGKSGHGKSTWISAFSGLIDGITLNKGTPTSYYHLITEYYQGVRDKIPDNHITVRQLFNDEKNDSIINRLLSLSCSMDWLDGLNPIHQNTDLMPKPNVLLEMVYKSFHEIENIRVKEEKSIETPKVVNKLDIDIAGRISGGQKSRLCLALKLYEFIMNKSQILILDEVEQGSDVSVAYELINNIQNMPELRGKVIILISHLERIKSTFRWTTYLHIEKGQIKLETQLLP